jgi:photosystem II stability/assembly factor-like uncharacterized protein
MSSFAQEEEVEDIQALVNPVHQQFAGYSMFDSQPLYNSDWEWLHQTPQGNTLRWVKMWDADNWYAAGYGGTFMKTTDGGASWFVNKNVVGVSSTGSNEIIYDGFFLDMDNGFLNGFGGIWRTTDGGLTWDSLYNFSTTATVYDIYFVNDTLGFVAGTSSMLVQRTTDGGVTWTALSPPSGTYYTVFAWDIDNIIAGSSSGNVQKTTDGGTTWTTVNVGQSSTLYGLKFTDTMNGWVSGTGDNPAYTTDGGDTWTLSASVPTTSTQYDVDVLSTVTYTFSESFTDVAFPPAGWHTKNLLGTNEWVRYTTSYNSSPASARISYQGTGGEDWLVTPQVPIVAGDSLKFFSRRYFSSSYPPDSLLILVSTTDTSVASFTTVIASYDVNAFSYPDFAQLAVDLSAFAGQNIYIAFRHFDTDGNGCIIDDVTIGEPAVSSEVYITGDSFNIYKSADMGTTWTPVTFLDPSQAWTSTYYSSDFLSPDNFVAVGAFGLINEVASGTPTCYTNWLRPGTLYSIWAQSNTGKVIAGGAASSTTSFNQVMYSNDGGQTWALSTIMDSLDVDFNKIFMVDTLIGYAACEDYNVYKTTDGGLTWFQVTQPAVSTSDFETCAFVDANTGYVFGASSGAFKTTDGGTTWTPLTTAITTVYASHFINATTGFIGGSSGGFEMTTDGGATFTPVTTSMGTSAIYSVYMVNSNVGYLCGSTGKVNKTTDGGATWNSIDPGTYTPTLYSLDFKDENNGMVVGSTGQTFYTNDGGATWTWENTSMSTVYGVYVEKFSTDTSAAYICGTNSYIMKNQHVIVPVELASFSASINGDDVTLSWMTATELNNSGFQVERTTGKQNWTELGFIQGHGTSSETQVYTFIDKDLVAGTYNYRIKQIDFDGTYKYFNLKEEVDISAPSSYDLSQNYPNPFNPSTKIKYSVPVEGLVNIAVYNILGEKVANLVNSVQKAGNYELTFNATNLASGMYIYRMESGNYVSIKKMMILK